MSGTALLQLLPGCSATSTTTPTVPSTVQSADTPQQPSPTTGGHITYGTFADARILNPILHSDSPSKKVTSLIFDSLVTVHPPDGRVVGLLAESWQQSADGLTYTFKLHSGVRFHDGTELTADDVKFTYEAILDEGINSPRRATIGAALAGPDSIVVKDPYTIEFRLKETYAPFLTTVPIYGILPKHLLGDKKGADFNGADFNRGPIGTGPFRFKEWVTDSHIILEAHADYFRGRPRIDQFVHKVVKDSTAVAAQLKTGEIDYAEFQPAMLEELADVPHLAITKFDDFSFLFYTYQLDPKSTTLFQDKTVRQALLYGLDRQSIVDAVLFGQGVVADSIFPLVSWARDPSDNPSYPYDPDRARQLLDQAGWIPGPDDIRVKDGQKLAFTVYTNTGNTVREAVTTIMQEQWKEIGVQVTPKKEEWTALVSRLTESNDFEIALVGFSWTFDPDPSPVWSSKSQQGGLNFNGYSNPVVDKLLDDALKVADREQRKASYKEIDQIVLDDLPTPILFYEKQLYAVNTRVQNLKPNAFDTYYNVTEWFVTDGR